MSQIDSHQWAQFVYKVEKNGVPYLATMERKAYGEGFEDIDDSALAETTHGMKITEKVKKMTDNDPNSPTFGKRIPDPKNSTGEKMFVFTDEMTDELIKEVETKCAKHTGYGISTQFIFLTHGKGPIVLPSFKALVEYTNNPTVKKVKKND